MRKGDAVSLLEMDFLAVGLKPEREYRFDPGRRWRFDYAFPDSKVAVEVDGGTYSGGRHTTGSGYAKDAEKMNAAIVDGWAVLRYTTAMIQAGAIEQIQAVVKLRGEQ